jgi:hypothetical protein
MKDSRWQVDWKGINFTAIAVAFGMAIILVLAAGYRAGWEARIPTLVCPICPAIPTPGSTDVPCSIDSATPEALKFRVMKTRLGVPTGFESDPAFWQMLTPAGQAVLSGVTVTISDEPRSYVCPQAYEVGAPTPIPAVCAYYGGMYEGDTNTISLWGEAAQANPDILRHEALHALDAAGGDGLASDNGFLKVAGELAPEAEALYNAGGGTWFRPNELWAMVPLLVAWDFDRLPDLVAAYYAQWFVGAALRSEEER